MGLQVWDDIHATKLSNDGIEENTRGATHVRVRGLLSIGSRKLKHIYLTLMT